MIRSKAIIDSVVLESEESRPIKTLHGTEWYNSSGELHRTTGPAVELDNGTTEWWVNGIPHREDGPASSHPGGHKRWMFNGNYHRLGGPALEFSDGSKQWYIHGRRFTENEFYRYVDQTTGEVFVPPGKKLTYGRR